MEPAADVDAGPATTSSDPIPSTSADPASPAENVELIEFTIVYGKVTTAVCRPAASTVGELKKDVEERLSIPAANQKLLCSGKAFKDDAATLKSLGLKKGAKVMLLGSSPLQAHAQEASSTGDSNWDAQDASANEPMCKQKQHAKVLEKGLPDDAIPSVKGKQIPLAAEVTAIPGILNSQGVKVRLTFKEELQQLWIASATTTQKVPYSTVTKIEAFPIDGREEYSIIALNLGSGASSKYWLYYVPSQHVASIKIRILGLESLL